MPKGFAGGHRNRPACCGGKNGKRFPERGKSFPGEQTERYRTELPWPAPKSNVPAFFMPRVHATGPEKKTAPALSKPGPRARLGAEIPEGCLRCTGKQAFPSGLDCQSSFSRRIGTRTCGRFCPYGDTLSSGPAPGFNSLVVQCLRANTYMT
jgi:hypothetical protein